MPAVRSLVNSCLQSSFWQAESGIRILDARGKDSLQFPGVLFK